MDTRFHAIATAGLLLTQAAFPARSEPGPAEGERPAPSLAEADARIKAGQLRESVRINGLPFKALSDEAKAQQITNLLSWVARENKARTDPNTGITRQPFEYAQLGHMIQFSTVDTNANFRGFTLHEIRSDSTLIQGIDKAIQVKGITGLPGVTNATQLLMLIEGLDKKLQAELKRHDYIK